MGPEGSLYEGKTLEEAVRKGLEDLGLGRAEAVIQVIEEGSGGFLGFGARPYKVKIRPRPGGAFQEPDERGGRGERAERGRRGRHERSDRERGGRSRREPARPVEAGKPERRSGERREPAGRADSPRENGRSEDERRVGDRRRPRRDGERREPRRTAGEKPVRQAAPAAGALPARESEGGDESRRRRGRRGGRRRREGREGGEPRESHAAPPQAAAPLPMAPAEPTPWRSDEPIYEPPYEPPARTSSAVAPAAAPAPSALSSAPDLSSAELADSARRATEELLKAMGFEARVNATADGENVDVTAELETDEELLTGRKGEVRQALQHLLNRMVNRGEGTRYHLQLEINEFWKRREDELRELARRLAEEAFAGHRESITEYLNSQERRIVHMTLKEDSRVKTYALGTGMIKRVAVAPADFPEGPRADE